MNKIKLIWNKFWSILVEQNLKEMSKKVSKYKITSATIRKANSMLIRNGISDRARSSYNGDINIEYRTKDGIIKKTFTNSDIKQAYEKALVTYAERI